MCKYYKMLEIKRRRGLSQRDKDSRSREGQLLLGVLSFLVERINLNSRTRIEQWLVQEVNEFLLKLNWLRKSTKAHAFLRKPNKKIGKSINEGGTQVYER